jgi:hypothetical protein
MQFGIENHSVLLLTEGLITCFLVNKLLVLLLGLALKPVSRKKGKKNESKITYTLNESKKN